MRLRFRFIRLSSQIYDRFMQTNEFHFLSFILKIVTASMRVKLVCDFDYTFIALCSFFFGHISKLFALINICVLKRIFGSPRFINYFFNVFFKCLSSEAFLEKILDILVLTMIHSLCVHRMSHAKLILLSHLEA